MRWSDVFGRTLREVGTGGGPGAAMAQRAALARVSGDECVLLPLGRLALARMQASAATSSSQGQQASRREPCADASPPPPSNRC